MVDLRDYAKYPSYGFSQGHTSWQIPCAERTSNRESSCSHSQERGGNEKKLEKVKKSYITGRNNPHHSPWGGQRAHEKLPPAADP